MVYRISKQNKRIGEKMAQEKGRILYKKIRYSKERVELIWVEKIEENFINGSMQV